MKDLIQAIENVLCQEGFQSFIMLGGVIISIGICILCVNYGISIRENSALRLYMATNKVEQINIQR